MGAKIALMIARKGRNCAKSKIPWRLDRFVSPIDDKKGTHLSYPTIDNLHGSSILLLGNNQTTIADSLVIGWPILEFHDTKYGFYK